jgi:hypothetical protein
VFYLTTGSFTFPLSTDKARIYPFLLRIILFSNSTFSIEDYDFLDNLVISLLDVVYTLDFAYSSFYYSTIPLIEYLGISIYALQNNYYTSSASTELVTVDFLSGASSLFLNETLISR